MSHGKRKEIYKYEAPWTVFAMSWSVRPDRRFRLALGSFVEEYNNKVSAFSLTTLSHTNQPGTVVKGTWGLPLYISKSV